MKKNLWFRRKTYGWGWTPVGGQGWLVIVLWLLALVSYPVYVEVARVSFSPLVFIAQTIVLTAALLFVCYLKGEKPRWQWGKSSQD